MKANVGCGKRDFGKDWLHIDGGTFDHLDSHDVFLPQLPSNYLDLLYSSHLIAYFDRAGFDILLKGWMDKLKPGGTLRIATPDFQVMSYLYKGGLHLNFILGPMYGKWVMGDETIYHKTVWDYNSLSEALTNAGFTNVRRYDHNKTEHAQFDDHSAAYIQGTLISLNIEATKPGV